MGWGGECQKVLVFLKQPKRIVRGLAARFPLPFLGVCIFGKGGDKVSTFVPVPLLLLCKKMKHFMPSSHVQHFS